MRKYKKIFLAILFTVLTFYKSNVYAIDPNEESYNQISKVVNISDLDNQINAIENQLSEINYSVEKSLEDSIKFYKNLILSGNLNHDKTIKTKELIDTLEQQLKDYNDYKYNNMINRKNDYSRKSLLKNISHVSPIITIDPYREFRIQVAAVNAWFYAKGYVLSSELLTHAVKNKNKNSVYSPVNGYKVENSPVFSKLKNKPYKSTGDDAFPNSGTTSQKDLYYAIHKFSWERGSSGYLIIRDYYDFEPNKYSSIQNIAVNAMYTAQRAGYLTPYHISISR
ncbi:hypothetical protein ABGF49_05260 [Helcococcus ovis]